MDWISPQPLREGDELHYGCTITTRTVPPTQPTWTPGTVLVKPGQSLRLWLGNDKVVYVDGGVDMGWRPEGWRDAEAVDAEAVDGDQGIRRTASRIVLGAFRLLARMLADPPPKLEAVKNMDLAYTGCTTESLSELLRWRRRQPDMVKETKP